VGLMFLDIDMRSPEVRYIFDNFNEVSKYRYFLNYHTYTNPTIIPSYTHVFQLIIPIENKLIFAHTDFIPFIKETLRCLYKYNEKYEYEFEAYGGGWLLRNDYIKKDKYYYHYLKKLLSDRMIPDNLLSDWENQFKMTEELGK